MSADGRRRYRTVRGTLSEATAALARLVAEAGGRADTLASTNPTELSRPAMQRSLAAMTNAGQSPSSVHQAAVFLSGGLAWARRQGQIEHNTALALRLPDGTVLAPPRRH